MLFCNSIATKKKEEFIDISEEIRLLVKKSRIKSGIATIFVPHTTAALTINENADPDVKKDLLKGLNSWGFEKMNFDHFEGNSPAHLKSSILGSNLQIIIDNSEPLLGTWQGIYFCEFDGPRNRDYFVKIIDG